MLASQQTNDERSESRADTPQLAAGSFIIFMENRAASMLFTAYRNSYLRKASLMRCQSGQSCFME